MIKAVASDAIFARGLIHRCEQHLQRNLTAGEKRDLLMDNSDWDSSYVREVVAFIELHDRC